MSENYRLCIICLKIIDIGASRRQIALITVLTHFLTNLAHCQAYVANVRQQTVHAVSFGPTSRLLFLSFSIFLFFPSSFSLLSHPCSLIPFLSPLSRPHHARRLPQRAPRVDQRRTGPPRPARAPPQPDARAAPLPAPTRWSCVGVSCGSTPTPAPSRGRAGCPRRSPTRVSRDGAHHERRQGEAGDAAVPTPWPS